MDFDIQVIGCGPAGCAAAICAARAGLRVLMFDARAKFLRAPGETLHPGVEPIFHQLGVHERITRASYYRQRGVWKEHRGRSRHFEPYGCDANGPWLGFQVERRKLNTILLDAALEAGAKVVRPAMPNAVAVIGSRVIGIAVESINYSAKWTLDATGRKAWLAQELGVHQEKNSPDLRVRFGWSNGPVPELEGQPLFREHRHGWSWYAPLGEHTVAWVELRGPTASHATKAIARGGGIDVSWRFRRACAGPGYFLLGDAAVLLDPSSSNGVLRALMSGVLAADLIAKIESGSLAEDCAIQAYRDWVGNLYNNQITTLGHGLTRTVVAGLISDADLPSASSIALSWPDHNPGTTARCYIASSESGRGD